MHLPPGHFSKQAGVAVRRERPVKGAGPAAGFHWRKEGRARRTGTRLVGAAGSVRLHGCRYRWHARVLPAATSMVRAKNEPEKVSVGPAPKTTEAFGATSVPSKRAPRLTLVVPA